MWSIGRNHRDVMQYHLIRYGEVKAITSYRPSEHTAPLQCNLNEEVMRHVEEEDGQEREQR